MEMNINTYYRNRLNDLEKQTYDALVPQWMHMYPEISVPGTAGTIKAATEAIHNDYSILFYVNYYSGNTMMLVPGLFNMPGTIKMKGQYLYDKDTARVLLDECMNWGRAITSRLPRSMSTLNKALWLFDVLTQNMVYSELERYEAHTIVGVVKYNKAVCEGNASAYKFLCDLADIPCIMVTGTLDGGNHAWNMIWIDGEPSHVDVTDGVSGKGMGIARKCFLRNDEDMKILGYSWDEPVIPKTRIHNLSNPLVRVSSKAELKDTVRKMKAGDAITVVVNIPNQRNQKAINRLVAEAVYASDFPQSLKSVSYSANYKFLFIEK